MVQHGGDDMREVPLDKGMTDDHAADSVPPDEATGDVDRRESGGPFCRWGISVPSALVGGLMAWIAFSIWYPVFTVPRELIGKLPDGQSPTADIVAAINAADALADGYNAVLFLGIFGALVAAVLVIGLGISRRDLRTIVGGGAVGALGGAAVGCIAGGLGWATYEVAVSAGGFSPLARTIWVHIAMLGALGGGVGMVLGTFVRRRRSVLTGLAYGVIAGVLSGLVFPILTAIVLVNASIQEIIPTGPVGNTVFNAQLLWIGVTAALLGLLIPSAFAERKS